MRITLLKKIVVIFALAAITLSGCTKQETRVIYDRSGRSIVIERPINRIVSTAPSNTEIIVDLGLADKLVAIDRHSVNIRALRPNASSITYMDGYPEIPEGIPLLDFFYPDAELILNIKPDIIIASGHNATGTGDDPFRLLGEMGIPVVYISMSRSIDDIYRDIAFVADLLHVQQRGEEVINIMKAEIAEITQRTAHIENKITVYFEISAAPEMVSFGRDSFLDDMISAIGAINIFANDNWIVTPGAESIIDRNPDVILTSVDYIDDPIEEIKNRPGFEHINAVVNNRVYQIDTDSSVRTSARITLALRQMSNAVYPYDQQ